MGSSQNGGSPVVTPGFNTKSWSTWMIWGAQPAATQVAEGGAVDAYNKSAT